ncbi:MAG: hypothetical protein NZL87_01425, partial [Thermomicrobium sp.]|nr:hypothetical protein [Thermomicrobium sp.]
LPSSARIGIGTNNPQAKLHVADTGCMIVPSGTTAQQPSPVVGGLRFDTTTGKLRFCDGSQWRDVGEGAGGGVVQTVTEQALREIVQVPHNTQLNAGHAFDRLRLQSGDLRLYGRIVEVTGSADATVTLPNATEPIAVGSLFVIRHALSAGQVTIAVPSGSSINGGSSVTIPWSGGVAVCTVESIGASNAVTYRARGDLSTPLDLPGVTVKGAATFESTVRGGRVSVGSNITGNVTLGADDVGRLRIVTASGVTVTVPNDWRGCAELHFTQAGTVNIGGQNKSVPANSRAVVEVVEVGGTPYRWLFVGGVA